MTTSTRRRSGVYLDFNGSPTDAADLCWAVFAKCGCLSGAMTVDRGNGDVLLTAEAARADMLGGRSVLIQRDIEEGFVYRLIGWDEYQATSMGCEHDPKWGIPVVDAPEGFVWATTDAWHTGRRTYKRHIVSADALNDYKGRHHAICGAPTNERTWPLWSTRDNDLHDTVTCRRCEEKAVQA